MKIKIDEIKNRLVNTSKIIITYIAKRLKKRFPRDFKSLVRALTFTNEQKFLLLVITCGLACGFIANAFDYSIKFITYLWYGKEEVGDEINPYLAVSMPVIGGLIVGFLIWKWFKKDKGGGIPYIKQRYHTGNGKIPKRAFLTKFLVSAITIGTGASVGKYGPTVHICASFAASIGRLFDFAKGRGQDLIAVGAAAGISSAFNTPIAGVVFTLEAIINDLNARAFGYTIISAVVAAGVTRSLQGEDPFLGQLNYQFNHLFEIVLFILLGVLTGVVSGLFSAGILKLKKQVKKLPKKLAPFQIAIGGIFVGLIAIKFPQVMGTGYDTTIAALNGNIAIDMLIMLALMKFVASIFSFSSGAPGGVFAPTLFIGAVLGAIVGHIAFIYLNPGLDLPLEEQISIGAYALVGMGAFFAGFIRAPFTAIIIVFELTHDYSLILPIMISSIISYTISKRFVHFSIYDALALQDGVRLTKYHGVEEEHLPKVSDAMLTKYLHLNGDITINEAYNQIKKLSFSNYPVLNENRQLIGLVHKDSIIRKINEEKGDKLIGEYAIKKKILHTFSDQYLQIAVQRMGFHQVTCLAVIDRDNPRELIGLLLMRDVLHILGVPEHGIPDDFIYHKDHPKPKE